MGFWEANADRARVVKEGISDTAHNLYMNKKNAPIRRWLGDKLGYVTGYVTSGDIVGSAGRGVGSAGRGIGSATKWGWNQTAGRATRWMKGGALITAAVIGLSLIGSAFSKKATPQRIANEDLSPEGLGAINPGYSDEPPLEPLMPPMAQMPVAQAPQPTLMNEPLVTNGDWAQKTGKVDGEIQTPEQMAAALAETPTPEIAKDFEIDSVSMQPSRT